MMPSQQQSVRTEVLTLETVSQKKIQFIIPSYQRPYVWDEEDVGKLFDDIRRSYQSQEAHYFVGSTLSAVQSNGDTLVYELIDGQQRTTTMMLISLAFKAENIDTPLANVSILDNAPRLTFVIRESVRNLLGSCAGLELFSKPGKDEIDSDPYLKHLNANLTVLKNRVEGLSKDSEFNIQGFARYIYENLGWVNNIVPEQLDLNRLFASMNTAGVQLEPVDLLKAKLFRLITTEKKCYDSIWLACEHTHNYFERNVRKIFNTADWNSLKNDDLATFPAEFSTLQSDAIASNKVSKSLASLLAEVGDEEINSTVVTDKDNKEDDEYDTVYCRSIISFELLLIHTLRIFYAQRGWPDLQPRIKSANLMVCFSLLLEKDESTIKAFLLLLWEVRFQFDKWIVKWVEHDDQADAALRLTYTTVSQSKGRSYINRKVIELNELVQLQAVRNFSGDRSAHYWLTPLLASLVANPQSTPQEVLASLEQFDNQLSLSTETQKYASFALAKGDVVTQSSWQEVADQLAEPKGTGFEHYWFQKLEYLLWKQGDKSDHKLKSYRITSKNSIEHVYPQNERYGQHLERPILDAFGNLALLSPGENSSYSDKPVNVKRSEFENKPRYDSLKLKDIFETCRQAGGEWSDEQIKLHQQKMLKVLEGHYR